FLGLNGAGKTTAIRLLLGLVAPTAGSCYLMGREIRAGRTKIWHSVGYIVETPQAYPELTVRRNLEIMRKLRGIRDKTAVCRVMEQLKLAGQADKKAKHLSLGNSQRLGLAKALLHQPQILLLDEPTNGLDPAGIVEMRQLLQRLAQDQGVTILVSSHKLAEISRLATHIGIIHRGKLIKEMTVQELAGRVQKKLVVGGADQQAALKVLKAAGYKNARVNKGLIEIGDEQAVRAPEKIASLLVEANLPPAQLVVEEEDLEKYFLRVLGEEGDGRA
ncbi:MAG TPA: ABC transporter ATP-binding protein, partial [Firmicutes bacterium]|nr:ABC transporter ATP-binding protein [Bacillota bacterium]